MTILFMLKRAIIIETYVFLYKTVHIHNVDNNTSKAGRNVSNIAVNVDNIHTYRTTSLNGYTI